MSGERMAWECTCGVLNHNDTLRCAGCGWSREESNPNKSDVEDQQPVEDINKGPYKKWGIGESILYSFLLPMVIQGIVENIDSPNALIIFIPLGILFIIWSTLP